MTCFYNVLLFYILYLCTYIDYVTCLTGYFLFSSVTIHYYLIEQILIFIFINLISYFYIYFYI